MLRRVGMPGAGVAAVNVLGAPTPAAARGDEDRGGYAGGLR
ncbi:MAG TPA: hypothetical protein VGX25_11280 [Actinophytocola sp.]|nr:hypothetical protein [Actinophytocola sp.]HEV2779968.1 hypothetical protein [Actinophytocola sp.]